MTDRHRQATTARAARGHRPGRRHQHLGEGPRRRALRHAPGSGRRRPRSRCAPTARREADAHPDSQPRARPGPRSSAPTTRPRPAASTRASTTTGRRRPGSSSSSSTARQFSRNGAVKEALADGVKTFVISWKETDLGAIRTFLAGIPDGLTVYTTFNHEPEDDHGKPGTTRVQGLVRGVQAPVVAAVAGDAGAGHHPHQHPHGLDPLPEVGSRRGRVDAAEGHGRRVRLRRLLRQGQGPVELVDRSWPRPRRPGCQRTGLAETGAPSSDPSRVLHTREMQASV